MEVLWENILGRREEVSARRTGLVVTRLSGSITIEESVELWLICGPEGRESRRERGQIRK